MPSDLTPIPVAIPSAVPAPSGVGKPAAKPAKPRIILTRRQKAAVIVHLLISEGADVPLKDLPEDQQADLTSLLAQMRAIDRDTLQAVIEEFVGEMDSIGLTFPGDIENALGLLDGHISPATSSRLRREAGVAARGDPWKRISELAPERLARVLEEESTEVGAVMLSKFSVAQSANLLGMLPGQRARELSYAISRTGKVKPETVQRIGLSLAAQLDAEPVYAFQDAPVERVGAILNSSRAATRDEVLEGLDETDAGFAAEVRRTIFTFANIPGRVTERDIPKVMRGIEQASLVQALGHCAGNPGLEAARDFILANMSKRMADALREEIEEAGPVNEADGENAMNQIVGEIRRLAEEGDLLLTADPE